MFWDANMRRNPEVNLPPAALVSTVPVAPTLWKHLWLADLVAGHDQHE